MYQSENVVVDRCRRGDWSRAFVVLGVGKGSPSYVAMTYHNVYNLSARAAVRFRIKKAGHRQSPCAPTLVPPSEEGDWYIVSVTVISLNVEFESKRAVD